MQIIRKSLVTGAGPSDCVPPTLTADGNVTVDRPVERSVGC